MHRYNRHCTLDAAMSDLRNYAASMASQALSDNRKATARNWSLVTVNLIDYADGSRSRPVQLTAARLLLAHLTPDMVRRAQGLYASHLCIWIDGTNPDKAQKNEADARRAARMFRLIETQPDLFCYTDAEAILTLAALEYYASVGCNVVIEADAAHRLYWFIPMTEADADADAEAADAF